MVPDPGVLPLLRHVIHEEACSRCILAAGLSQSGRAVPVAAAPDRVESFQKPRPGRDWANRLQANDPKVRATAEAALVQGAARSLPLLRRFLTPSMKTCMW